MEVIKFRESPGRKRIADILCTRDECSFREAMERIRDTIEQIEACGFEPDETEDIIADNLGLEMDYIFDLLD